MAADQWTQSEGASLDFLQRVEGNLQSSNGGIRVLQPEVLVRIRLAVTTAPPGQMDRASNRRMPCKRVSCHAGTITVYPCTFSEH